MIWISISFWLFLSIAAGMDAKWGIVPNRLNLLATLILPLLVLWYDPSGWWIRLVLGSFLLLSLLIAYGVSLKITGRQEVGGGDVKLIFWFGMGMGVMAPVAILWTIFFFLLAVGFLRLMGKWETGNTLPLIPYLWLGSLAAWITF